MKKNEYKFVLLEIIFILLTIPCSKAQNLLDTQVLKPDKIVGAEKENIFLLNQAWRVKYNEFDKLLYVIDFKDNDIKVFDTDLNFIRKFGRFGQGPGEFQSPFDIAFDKEGKIYVAEFSNARIQIFDKNFKSIATIRHQFNHFLSDNIDVDSKGNIYTCGNKFKDKIIFIYNFKRELIEKFGNPLFGEKDGYKKNWSKKIYINKVHFSVDKNDDVYCGYQLKPIIQKYNRNHKLIYQIDLSNLEPAKKEKKYYESIKNPAIIVDYIMYMTIDDSYIYVKLKVPDKKDKDYNQVYILRKADGKIVTKKDIKVFNNGQKTEFVFYLEPAHPEYLFFTEVLSCSIVRIKKSDVFSRSLK